MRAERDSVYSVAARTFGSAQTDIATAHLEEWQTCAPLAGFPDL